jgi:hypothetical protein
MRRNFFTACLFGFIILYGTQNGFAASTPSQAASKVGAKVTIEFVVKGAGYNDEGYHELYSEPAWENKNCFFVRFPNRVMAKLATQKIDSIDYYLDDVVTVTGVVGQLDFGEHGKRPVIYVNDLSQFRARAGKKADYTPTSDYKVVKAAGFTVFIHPEVQSHPEDMKAGLDMLETQLTNIQNALPKDKLAQLSTVRFWLEWDLRPDANAMAWVHGGTKGQLKHAGLNPDKANDVVIGRLKVCVNNHRKGQPWFILHELAHSYHFLVLGGENAAVKAAYKQAMERKLYDNVKDLHGRKGKAYAATNEFEYFAEITTAFFGKCPWFPFVREDLKELDPVGFKLMQDIWGVRALDKKQPKAEDKKQIEVEHEKQPKLEDKKQSNAENKHREEKAKTELSKPADERLRKEKLEVALRIATAKRLMQKDRDLAKVRLNELVRRFPDSPEAREARDLLKMLQKTEVKELHSLELENRTEDTKLDIFSPVPSSEDPDGRCGNH